MHAIWRFNIINRLLFDRDYQMLNQKNSSVTFSWTQPYCIYSFTYSALLAVCAGNSPVTGDFPAQRPVTRSFDTFFDLRLNKRFSKQSWGGWFETPSCPLWRNCNDIYHNTMNTNSKLSSYLQICHLHRPAISYFTPFSRINPVALTRFFKHSLTAVVIEWSLFDILDWYDCHIYV